MKLKSKWCTNELQITHTHKTYWVELENNQQFFSMLYFMINSWDYIKMKKNLKTPK